MKTRIITAVVGIVVLIGVLFTFDTLIFNLVITAITLIALHEIYAALGFEKQGWPLLGVLVPYTFLIMLSSYELYRRLVMPASFLVVLFYAIYLVVRNGTISYQKASGLAMFSGIVIFCFYSFIRLKELLPVVEYGYDAVFFILLILCFAWGGDTCAYFAGRAFGKHKLCPDISPKKTVEGAVGGLVVTVIVFILYAMGYKYVMHLNGIAFEVNYLLLSVVMMIATPISMVGDLSASLLKREYGIKDYGKILPGHGGIVDRFDSVYFVLPYIMLVFNAFGQNIFVSSVS